MIRKLSGAEEAIVTKEATSPQIIVGAEICRTGKFSDDRYGDFEITVAMFEQMVKNFNEKARGVECALDYSHESHKEAAGWFKKIYIEPNQKGGHSLLGDIALTPKGSKLINEKEYVYLSIEYDTAYVDPETKKEFGYCFYGAGLTNRPAIKHMASLVALSEEDKSFSKKLSTLVSEGYSQEQAVAISLQLRREGKLSDAHNKETEMTDEQKKKLADAEAAHADMKKKLEDQAAMMAKLQALMSSLGVADVDALTNKIAEMQKKIDESTQEGMSEGDLKPQLAEAKKEVESLKKQLSINQKTAEFAKLLSEGKACEAQRDAFITGNMLAFIEKAQPVKLNEVGHGGKGFSQDAAAAEDEVLEKAQVMVKEKKIALDTAISKVLHENPELAKRYNSKFDK